MDYRVVGDRIQKDGGATPIGAKVFHFIWLGIYNYL